MKTNLDYYAEIFGLSTDRLEQILDTLDVIHNKHFNYVDRMKESKIIFQNEKDLLFAMFLNGCAFGEDMHTIKTGEEIEKILGINRKTDA